MPLREKVLCVLAHTLSPQMRRQPTVPLPEKSNEGEVTHNSLMEQDSRPEPGDSTSLNLTEEE